MSIYVTGDCHGDFTRFKENEKFRKWIKEDKNNNHESFVVVTGDFGLLISKFFDIDEFLNFCFLKINCKAKILFVDGNHECHSRLNEMPEEEWNGGKVHFLSQNIIHLLRGQIYEIEGKKFFTFGGALSDDVNERTILYRGDPEFEFKKMRLEAHGRYYRVAYEDWWPEERPSIVQMLEGKDNLKKNGYEVDYVITHCAPQSIQRIIYKGDYQDNPQTEYFEEIKNSLKFKTWFFGHYHDNEIFNENKKEFRLLYEDIIKIT